MQMSIEIEHCVIGRKDRPEGGQCRRRRYEWGINYQLKRITNELVGGSVIYSYDSLPVCLDFILRNLNGQMFHLAKLGRKQKKGKKTKWESGCNNLGGKCNMRDRAFWIETFYSSGNVKNLHFQIKGKTDEIALSIPNIKLGGEIPCRFKIIIDEVNNENKLLLGSKILGNRISEQTYRNVLISKSQLVYSHENEYKLAKNETTQDALRKGVLEKRTSCSRINNVLDGEYDVQIQIFQKYPQEPQLYSDEAPPYLTDYEQKIITISVYVLFFKNSCTIRNNNELTNASFYGGLGHLGFFMTDLVKFNEFIKKEIGSQPANLVELFSSTDLVDKCFEEGILIITWGIKPWHYYIFTDNASLDFDDKVIVSGTYRLKSDIKVLSVIPGTELINWPSCINKKWPQIYLEGRGENVSLSLYTWNGKLGNELIAAYILQRKLGEAENTVPILNYSF